MMSQNSQVNGQPREIYKLPGLSGLFRELARLLEDRLPGERPNVGLVASGRLASSTLTPASTATCVAS